MPDIACEICGKRATRIRRVTKSYGRGKTLFLVEGVPIVSCQSCGESYLTPEVMHQLDALKARRSKIAARRQVPVAQFK